MVAWVSLSHDPEVAIIRCAVGVRAGGQPCVKLIRQGAAAAAAAAGATVAAG